MLFSYHLLYFCTALSLIIMLSSHYHHHKSKTFIHTYIHIYIYIALISENLFISALAVIQSADTVPVHGHSPLVYKLIPYPMDRQGPPIGPRYQLTRGLNMFRQRKRCYDVTLSRQEGSMRRHLANAHSVTGPAGSIYRTCFSGVWRAWSR